MATDTSDRSLTAQEKYMRMRRVYEQLLNRGIMFWIPTNQLYDLNVAVSRVYTKDMHEYLIFMRIKPGGFRAPRQVPGDSKIRFHLIHGSVIFRYKDKDLLMKRLEWIQVKSPHTYAIRSAEPGKTAYLLMQYLNSQPKESRPVNRQPPRPLALEGRQHSAIDASEQSTCSQDHWMPSQIEQEVQKQQEPTLRRSRRLIEARQRKRN